MPKNAVPQPASWKKIEDGSILVFDGLFSQELVEALAGFMLSRPYTKRPSFDNELSAALDKDFFTTLPTLPRTLDALVKAYAGKMSSKRSPQFLSHVYCAAIRHDDHTMVHRDANCADCVTFLYYGNQYWNADWGGETVFFDNARDAQHVVLPKPGRLAMFNAGLLHRAGVPQRQTPAVRYGMSAFYRCKARLGVATKPAPPAPPAPPKRAPAL